MQTCLEHRIKCGWLLAGTLALAMPACTVVRSTAGSAVETRQNTAQAIVGPAGGTLSTPDAELTLIVPRAAVDHDVDFTVGPAAAPLPSAIGTAYEVGPLGTRFAVPAQVSIRYSAADLRDAAATDLVVATVVGGRWQALESRIVDPDASTVTGQTAHLSLFALVNSAAVGSSSTGGLDGGNCAADDSSRGTCANPVRALCANAPGTILVACSNEPFGGYIARCCPMDAGEATVDASLPTDARGTDVVSDSSSDSVAVSSDGGAVCVNDSAPTGTCSAPARPLCAAFPRLAVAACKNNPAGGGYAAVCCPVVDAGKGGG
jgi:hypothetical protein